MLEKYVPQEETEEDRQGHQKANVISLVTNKKTSLSAYPCGICDITLCLKQNLVKNVLILMKRKKFENNFYITYLYVQ